MREGDNASCLALVGAVPRRRGDDDLPPGPIAFFSSEDPDGDVSGVRADLDPCLPRRPQVAEPLRIAGRASRRTAAPPATLISVFNTGFMITSLVGDILTLLPRETVLPRDRLVNGDSGSGEYRRDVREA